MAAVALDSDVAVGNAEMTAPLFASLTDELLLEIAEFLPPRDLLQFQCCSKELSQLDTNSIWKDRCEKRWQPWPRYRLTKARTEALDSTLFPNSNWKTRYVAIEQDATRTILQPQEFLQLDWYLSFVLSGIRGEGRSDHLSVTFTPEGYLMLPGYPPLPYELMNEAPQASPERIRSNLRGDQPFSDRQWLRISDFPPHFITRKQSTAEWLIVNENVMMVSNSSTKNESR